MAYRDFTELDAWQLGFSQLIILYKVIKVFPDDEKWGMTADIRRAANSSIHNIAEGFGRFESRDKSRFYKISRGSCYELISQLLVSVELGYLSKDQAEEIILKYKQMIKKLDGLIKSVETR